MATSDNRRRDATAPSLMSTNWVVTSAGSGLLAGLAMAFFTMAISAAAGDGFVAPPRFITGLLFGENFAGEGFEAVPVITGALVHTLLSTIFGVIFGFLMGLFTNRLPKPLKLVAGLLWGLALWAFNTALISALLPGQELIERGVEVTAIPDWSWAAGHLVYGGMLGLLYAVWRGDQTTLLR